MTAGGRPRRVVLGCRRSRLARTQADRVAGALRRTWPDLRVESLPITTEGDRVLDRPLSEIGGKGLFTAEIEAALEGGRVDLAVHSLKDLPTDLGEAFDVVAVPERVDPRDVLLGPDGPLAAARLPPGSVVGTSSLRRRAQLLALRPDCEARDIRGNVETRIEKMRGGEFDAVILAAAGLERLELLDSGGPFLEPPGWLPAPAQGALAVEGRADDREVRELAAALEEGTVRAEVDAERSLLAALQGGCLVPIGALARPAGKDTLHLDAVVLSPRGDRRARASGRAAIGEARELGRSLAGELRAKGADEILAAGERA